MTILDPSMSLEQIKTNLGVLGVVDMRQLLLSKAIKKLQNFLNELVSKKETLLSLKSYSFQKGQNFVDSPSFHFKRHQRIL